MAHTLLSRGRTMRPRSAQVRRSLRSLTLFSAITPVLLAAIPGCGDTINNQYFNNYYQDQGGEAPNEPPPARGDGGGAGEGTSEPPPARGDGGAAGESPDLDLGGAGAGGAMSGDDQGGGGAGGDDGRDPRYPDAPYADTRVEDQQLDIFGTWGNRYWFAVSEEQRLLMNQDTVGGGWMDGLYTPGSGGKAHWVDHLFITTAGDAPQTADYGKVQAKVVGNYSRFDWSPQTIPNLNIDADEFVEGLRIAGYEHLRFSNGQRGSIFRDKLAYDLYRKLDYPAPLATYAWVQSNVWGPNISIPYTLVERYKRLFCERYKEQFGGGCTNMWEFAGDFNNGGWGGGPIPVDIKGGGAGVVPIDGKQGGAGLSLFDDPNNCQIDECDNTRVKELESKLGETSAGPGFKAALADYIDWPAFHRFQCLSWVLSTGDDTIHAGNNVVLVERTDGKFQYLPYSIDLSMGSSGWNVGLEGQSMLARGCHEDPTCWSDTLDMCDDVIKDLTDLKPNDYAQSLYDKLDQLGMLRPGDQANFRGITDYFDARIASLPDELAGYRAGNTCTYPYVACNGTCVLYECVDPCLPPPDKGLAGMPIGEELGAGGASGVGGGVNAAGAGPVECPVIKNYAP